MFEIRADMAELLDRVDLDETLALQSYRFMGIVNRFFGGAASVRNFVETELRRQDKSRPLKILDIGSGGCDIPTAVCRWADTRGLDVEFTCVEPSRYAAQAAHPNIAQFQNIKLVQEDIFAYRPTERFDCATGSLFFHHLTDEKIIVLIARLRTFGCRSILIDDLHRSWCCYVGGLAASLLAPAGVRHDALMSIRRGFRPDELRQLLSNIPQTHIDVRTAWFGRICAIVRFDLENDK